MRILLIGAYDIDVFYPIGLLCLASYIKAKEPNVEIEIVTGKKQESLKRAIQFKPDVVGISAMTPGYELATELAYEIKGSLDIPIVIGGSHITLLPESFRRCFDIGVLGEGEETFLEVIRNLKDVRNLEGIIYWDNSGQVVKNPTRKPLDLESYPDLDYSFVDKNLFKVKAIGAWGRFGVEGLMETTRGCPFKCIFCATTRIWKRPRYFPISWVVNNVKKLIELGCTHIHLTDDLFTSNKKRLREIASEFTKHGIQDRVQFNCSARTSVFDEEFCDLLKSVGCTTIFFGFESGNDRMVKYLKGEQCSVEENKEAVRICYRKDMECWGAIMIGAPTETIEEMLDTIEFVKWCKKYKVRRVCIGVITPYPGTPLWEYALNKGRVRNDMNFDTFELIMNQSPILVDDEVREKFPKIKDMACKAAHSYKWNKIWTLFKSGPIRTIRLALDSPWWIIKRMFVPTIP